MKTREAIEIDKEFPDYATQAQAQVNLRTSGPAPEKDEKALLALADEMADSASIDGWGVGLFWIERIAAEARRAGREALVARLQERMKRIDASYTPGAASASGASGAVGAKGR